MRAHINRASSTEMHAVYWDAMNAYTTLINSVCVQFGERRSAAEI